MAIRCPGVLERSYKGSLGLLVLWKGCTVILESELHWAVDILWLVSSADKSMGPFSVLLIHSR